MVIVHEELKASTKLNSVVRRDNAVNAGKSDLAAPGHRYDPRTGTGVEWLPPDPGTGEGVVRLWARHWGGESRVIAEASHTSVSPAAYWRALEFACSFPDVTHWWFGSAWTGRVWVSRPIAATDGTTLTGWMRFGDEDEPWLPWTATASDPVFVRPAQPPMHVSPLNLPLETALAQLIVAVLRGDRAPEREEWVTSLVRREDLERVFSDGFGQPWRLDRIGEVTVRDALWMGQAYFDPGKGA